ncbi:hybrid sensor histidine kinase/response regulator [Caballeronia concitans]|uniref:histidine kinase n=1 Tax=Caballeronia concitans TaxID=1777133 RepID=A0A658QWY9_9BURK|nr:ATP-binding protein [Caballeronia concitans]KIG02942.1 multi-sensor hybrid histidine kinase [Burkholderia sp. MR1]SAL30050.1 PAS/PAC sensor hybrid histidine kinase [Caballeronia concitans]
MPDFWKTAFEGGGGVRALLREFDWSASPLGHPSGWPAPLTTAVRMVLSSAFPMFVAWGPELRFLYNDAYAVMLGGKHPAALGGRFEQIWSEVWRDIEPIVDSALADRSSYFEDLPLTVIRHGYAEQSFFTFSYSPLHENSGRVGGMYCTVIETTERVLAERRAAFELQVSEALRPLNSPEDVVTRASALLGEQLKLARVMYGECDETGNTFFVPRDWTAPPLASLAGTSFALDDFGPAIVNPLRAGQVVTASDSRTDPRTVEFGISYALTGIRALVAVPLIKAGRLVAFLGLHRAGPYQWTPTDIRLARDMAERTWAAVQAARAQAELRAERDCSRYIFDTIGEGFMLMDRNWDVTYMNAEGLRIVRLTKEQVIGRSHWQLWSEAVASDCARMYRRVTESGNAGASEYCQSRSDGNITWLEVRAYSTDEGGIASFFRDVTDRKVAEEKLRAADQRKDEFLAMLAHELRNPLAPISAAAGLLQVSKLDEAQVRHSSAIIARQVAHMTTLVNDLLDVSRVTRGLVALARAPVSAQTVIAEAIEQVRPLMQGRAQQLSVHLPSVEATVLGDKARLVQVAANLLHNAAKYTPDGRLIEIRAHIDGDELAVTVRDEGIGMAPELTARAFDLFAQAERSSDRSLGGLGLGLALVKNLVELHGGSVRCFSEGLGNGSTFVVRLPLMRVQQVAAGRHAEKTGVALNHRLKLLVVDDNVDGAEALGTLLASCGHEVFVEYEPRRALERAARERPNACLLDIGLPDMDGNELARRLRERPETADATLIAVTGYGQDEDRQRSAQAGFDHHLVKPVIMEQLAALLAGIDAKKDD